MLNQLNLIRILVTVTLNPENHPQLQLNDNSSRISELSLTREKLYTAIRENVFGTSHTSVVMRQIRQVQYDCIHLLNVLNNYKKDKIETIKLYDAAGANLEHILNYIEKDHVQFFNFNVSMPVQQQQTKKGELLQSYVVLKMVLKKQRIPSVLIKLITGCVTDFIEQTSYSYRHLTYMQSMISDIINLEAPDGDYVKALKELLIYLKFNHWNFVGKYVHLIRKEVSELYDVVEQYGFICRYKKWLCALPEHSIDRYDASRPSLKMLLIEYVTAELEFLERSAGVDKNQEKMVEIYGSNYRIKLAISASVLVYFIRLLMDLEVTVTKPRTLLMEFVSRHFQTIGIGSECLSAGSLETKYKQVTQNTIMSVCALLKQMLRKAEKQLSSI